MIGRRTLGLSAGLLIVLVVGRAMAPTIHRVVVLNPQLRDALENNNLARAEHLIRSGADVNLKADFRGYFVTTPLILAARVGRADAISRLIRAGADPAVVDEHGRTAFAWAAISDDPTTVKALLAEGLDINRQDNLGRTPLMTAAEADNPRMVRLLLSFGANVLLRDEHGDTALVYASARRVHSPMGGQRRFYRDLKMVRLLLDAGADLHASNNSGRTVLAQAEMVGELPIAKYLRSKGARGLRNVLAGVPEAELFYAVRTRNLKEVKRLLHKGASVAVQDRDGWTPLMHAVREPGGLIIRLLLKQARDVKKAVNIRDQSGRSALNHADGYEYSFKLLLAAGGTLDLSNAHDCYLYEVTNLRSKAIPESAVIRRK